MAKKKCPPCPAVAKWMTTFSDMSTLLLTFFVLLITMATFDETKIIEAFGFFSGSKHIFDTRTTSTSQTTMQPIINYTESARAKQQDQMEQSMQEYVQSQNLQQMISVIKTDKGFSIRIIDSMLFRTGSYEILPDARPVLDKIAALAADSSYNVNIEGHTDDVQGLSPYTNWDLSSNRAMAVLKYFLTQGVSPQMLSATGFGEYHPAFTNITDENRARNRRVEINFIDPQFAESNKNTFEDE